MKFSEIPADILKLLRSGTAIPAHPLALDASRRLDARRQRALSSITWTRVRAAERNTSMSRYVGELLREQMAHEDEYERARRAYFADRTEMGLRDSPGEYPKREGLYDRPGLR